MLMMVQKDLKASLVWIKGIKIKDKGIGSLYSCFDLILTGICRGGRERGGWIAGPIASPCAFATMSRQTGNRAPPISAATPTPLPSAACELLQSQRTPISELVFRGELEADAFAGG
jgi:hypothetical protein